MLRLVPESSPFLNCTFPVHLPSLFFQNFSRVSPVLAVAKTGSCVGLQNTIRHRARGHRRLLQVPVWACRIQYVTVLVVTDNCYRFLCWPAEYNTSPCSWSQTIDAGSCVGLQNTIRHPARGHRRLTQVPVWAIEHLIQE